MLHLRFCIVLAAALGTACSGDAGSKAGLSTAWRVIQAPHDGDTELDRQIARSQSEIAKAADPVPHLQRLGFLLVTKARTTFDPGFYKLAEQCAACIEERQPGDASALLLRGHVLHSLHQFEAAERLARELVAKRGSFLDQGLLGDVLLDRGDLEAALACYQKMLDLKPCLQSYSRAARVRWLRGDLDGARELMRLATSSGSRRDPEPLCWSYAQLATLELQAGNLDAARTAASTALEVLPDYAPAWLALGRIELAAGDVQAGVAQLRHAVAARPEPEYKWALADALRDAGRADQAAPIEAELERTGALDDPRTFAVYLATRAKDVGQALQLTEAELIARRDIYTHDAHAWALLAAGRHHEAGEAIDRALAEGTQDARLFYHAGAIAAANGDRPDALAHFARAEQLARMLLPSERHDLQRRRAAL